MRKGLGNMCMAAEVGLTIHMATVENYAEPGQKFVWSRDGSWVGPLGMWESWRTRRLAWISPPALSPQAFIFCRQMRPLPLWAT